MQDFEPNALLIRSPSDGIETPSCDTVDCYENQALKFLGALMTRDNNPPTASVPCGTLAR